MRHRNFNKEEIQRERRKEVTGFNPITTGIGYGEWEQEPESAKKRTDTTWVVVSEEREHAVSKRPDLPVVVERAPRTLIKKQCLR